MSHDSDRGRLLEPVPAKVNPAGGKANNIPLLLALGALPLLLANFFIVATILGRDCVLLYGGGNITECVGGLSEEQMSVTSGLIALMLFVIQMVLIVLVNRRIRSRS